MEPDDVRVLQLLEHLQLVLDGIESRPLGHAEPLALEVSLVHLFHRVLLTRLIVLTELNLGEAACTNPLKKLIVIDSLALPSLLV